MEILVNGDYHEFHFSGPAQRCTGQHQLHRRRLALDQLPGGPGLAAFDYSMVPGNMGQAWLGTLPSRFCTITSATIRVKNELDTRPRIRIESAARDRPGTAIGDGGIRPFSRTTMPPRPYQAARQQSPDQRDVPVGRDRRTGDGVYT